MTDAELIEQLQAENARLLATVHIRITTLEAKTMTDAEKIAQLMAEVDRLRFALNRIALGNVQAGGGVWGEIAREALSNDHQRRQETGSPDQGSGRADSQEPSTPLRTRDSSSRRTDTADEAERPGAIE